MKWCSVLFLILIPAGSMADDPPTQSTPQSTLPTLSDTKVTPPSNQPPALNSQSVPTNGQTPIEVAPGQLLKLPNGQIIQVPAMTQTQQVPGAPQMQMGVQQVPGGVQLQTGTQLQLGTQQLSTVVGVQPQLISQPQLLIIQSTPSYEWVWQKDYRYITRYDCYGSSYREREYYYHWVKRYYGCND